MQRFIKSKFLILAIIGIFVLYLSNDFSLIDIKESAIIVALGVDKENGRYEVSAQIAIPQATDQTASNYSTVLTGKGETVSRALENIGIHTGWYPKLSFCNIIMLGKGLFDGDIMESIDYFLRTTKIQDTAELCAAENTAKEILTAFSPLDEISAFSLIKILQKDAESSSSVTFTSIREFAMGYYSKSGFSLMPVVSTIKVDGKGEGKGNQAAGSFDLSRPASSTEGGGDKKNQTLFSATKTLLFKKGRASTVLDEKQTMLFNLLDHPINEASIQIKNTEHCGKPADLFLALRNNRGKITLTVKNGRPIVNVRLKVAARIDDTNVSVSPENLAGGYTVPENVLKDLEKELSSVIVSAFEKARADGCDLFEIKDRLYRTQNKYYAALENRALTDAAINVTVKAESLK